MKTNVFAFMVLLVLVGHSLCYAQGPGFKASSEYDHSYQTPNAFDGDLSTRWASAASRAAEFLQVDFGEVMPVSEITIIWEAAFARGYDIQVSDNETDWKSVVSVSNGKGGKVEHKGLNARGRYVRISCKNGNTLAI